MPMLIDNMIPKGHITTIVARGGEGKTLISFAISKAIITNNKHLQLVFFDFDNGLMRGADMIKTAMDKLGDNIAVIGDASPKELMTEFKGLKDSSDDLSSYIVVIDALQSFASATGAKISDNDSMTNVMDEIKKLRKRGATIILIHHANKIDRENKQDVVFRGAESIRDATDTMFLVSKAAKITGPDNTDICLNMKLDKQSFSSTDVNIQIDIDRSTLDITSEIAITTEDLEKQKEIVEAGKKFEHIVELVSNNQGISKTCLYNMIQDEHHTTVKTSMSYVKQLIGSGLIN